MLGPKFEPIFQQHINALNSYALKLTQNKMDADDLVQESLHSSIACISDKMISRDILFLDFKSEENKNLNWQ